MKDFAKYAFNKSHAAAYSLVTYQTAYLKTYYKPEFLTAVLNNRITKIDEITNYVSYAKDEQIPVLPPDINESKTEFSVKDGKIRFGLAAVKGVGIAVIDEIIKERENNGKFVSFEDFALRTIKYINKRLVENLIFAGAFDCFNIYRSRLIAVYEEVLDKAQAIVKRQESIQIDIFGGILGEPEKIEVKYPNLNEYDLKTKLSYEKSVIGVYVSGHPLSNYESELKKYTFNTLKLLSFEENENGEKVYTDFKDGDYVEMAGIITSIKKIATKSGQFMAALTLEDMYGIIELVMFPKVYEKYRNEVEADAIVKITGRIRVRDDKPISVTVDKYLPLKEKEQTNTSVNKVEKRNYLVIKADNLDTYDELYDILMGYPGDVLVYIIKNGQKLKLNYNIRKSNGLISELNSILNEDEFNFIET
jgi:DNA polymerase-3 subunit alpha